MSDRTMRATGSLVQTSSGCDGGESAMRDPTNPDSVSHLRARLVLQRAEKGGAA